MKFDVELLKKLELGERFLRRNPVFYPNARRRFDWLEEGDYARRRAWVRTRLRAVLKAATSTPYARSVRAGTTYESWPLLEKTLLRERPEDFLARRSWFVAPAATGGTTGIPLKLVRSAQSVAVEQACIDRMFEKLGVDPRTAKVAVLRGDNIAADEDPMQPYWRYALNGRRLLLSSNRLSAGTLPQYRRALEAFAPDVLYAYPSSLEQLCLSFEQVRQTLKIPCAITSSEVLRPECWHLARRVLGCRMIDYYGQAERLGFASASEPKVYRFLPGYAYLELLPQQTTRGMTSYEIVGTSLWNFTFPLVRYRTGDLIRLPASMKRREIEEVTLGLRPFSGVLGREQEVLLAPQGVRLTGINQVPRNVEHVVRVQVIQEAVDDVRILVIPDEGYSAVDAEKLMRNVRLKVPDSMRVRIETAEHLERTALGKTPFIIHRPPVRQALNGDY